jgi:hypothetical protein
LPNVTQLETGRATEYDCDRIVFASLEKCTQPGFDHLGTQTLPARAGDWITASTPPG